MEIGQWSTVYESTPTVVGTQSMCQDSIETLDLSRAAEGTKGEGDVEAI